ncbi:triose-phosphate isomerase [Candidatus Wolfebacteria bacterium]|nr:triose-phosphate isomerase [Candidatus Wolfebacteria bacterium]
MNKKIIIFNWKMAPQSFREAKRLLTYYKQQTTNDKNSEIVICPPFIYLENLKLKNKNLKFSAQDVFWENPAAGKGAYTGEISAKMLKNIGVEYVIIGHSERRKYLNETDETINKKIKVAFKAGLKVILCVGELKRKSGIKQAKNYIRKQLEKDLKEISKSSINNLLVAYEPVWAIGTGNFCCSENALEMIIFIKNILNLLFKNNKCRVLYGGSVDSKNIKDFLRYKEINGVLIGSASLKLKEIEKILK